MILKIVEASLRQRRLVLLFTLLLVGVGVWSSTRLPIDSVPDITNPQVLVNTAVLALAPGEIETLVTRPIENEMSGLPGMIELRSLSKFGLSQVRMTFRDGVDIYQTRQLIAERLLVAAEELPPGLQPRLAPISTALGEIFYYAVEYADDAKKPVSRPKLTVIVGGSFEFIARFPDGAGKLPDPDRGRSGDARPAARVRG